MKNELLAQREYLDIHPRTVYVSFSYNFCWPVRTLRTKDTQGRWQARTPAMAAELADHVWTIKEWGTFPVKPG